MLLEEVVCSEKDLSFLDITGLTHQRGVKSKTVIAGMGAVAILCVNCSCVYFLVGVMGGSF